MAYERPEWLEKIIDVLEQAVEDEVPFIATYYCRLKDGERARCALGFLAHRVGVADTLLVSAGNSQIATSVVRLDTLMAAESALGRLRRTLVEEYDGEDQRNCLKALRSLQRVNDTALQYSEDPKRPSLARTQAVLEHAKTTLTETFGTADADD